MIYIYIHSTPPLVFYKRGDIYTGEFESFPFLLSVGDLRNSVSLLGSGETANTSILLENTEVNSEGVLYLVDLLGEPPLREEVDIYDTNESASLPTFTALFASINLLATASLVIEV